MSVLVLLIGGGAFYYFGREQKEEIVVEEKTISKKEEKKDLKEEELVSVDVKGEVNVPGMYSVSPHMRVLDVINQAGGLTESADTTVLNLSKKVQDEMVIIVYSREQVQHFKEAKEEEASLQEKCKMPDENSLQNDACIGEVQTISDKININTATKEELMRLTGIGESKAKDIINYRNLNGGFQSIEDIKKVPGIGESIYAQIQENITV